MTKKALTKTLSLKYRPLSIKDVVGQSFSKKVFIGALKKNKVPQSILISGGTGTGKTTFSRIIGTHVNCQKRNEHKICLSSNKKIREGSLCESCRLALIGQHPDIHEINAANSRKIEDVRNIIKFADTMPNFNHRVFIIDEMQELTHEAEKAILKPLEEPPQNTMWVLASMEPERIPTAISSRCLSLPFNDIDKSDIIKLVKRIAEKEKIKVSDKVINWIYNLSNSVPRDAIRLLETLMHISSYNNEKSIEEVPDEVNETLIQSGLVGSNASALIILSLLYVRNPLVYAFLQKGVTENLLRDLYNMQDSFIAHMAFGSKNWKWNKAMKVIQKVLKNEIQFNAYSLPIEYHIVLGAILGKAIVQNRTFNNPGIALRQACSEWWMHRLEGEEIEENEEEFEPMEKEKSK